METIIDKSWDYTLYKDNEDYTLSVVCGSVGIYEIDIMLTNEEKEEYNNMGEKYIETLARSIQQNPSTWEKRTINKPN